MSHIHTQNKLKTHLLILVNDGVFHLSTALILLSLFAQPAHTQTHITTHLVAYRPSMHRVHVHIAYLYLFDSRKCCKCLYFSKVLDKDH